MMRKPQNFLPHFCLKASIGEAASESRGILHIQASENSSQNVSVLKKARATKGMQVQAHSGIGKFFTKCLGSEKKARAKGGMQVQSLICCFKWGLLQKVSKRIQIWKRLFYWLSCCALFCIFEEFRGESQFQCWQYNDFLQVYHIKGQQETHTVQLYHHGSMLGNMVYQWFQKLSAKKKFERSALCIYRAAPPQTSQASQIRPFNTVTNVNAKAANKIFNILGWNIFCTYGTARSVP